MKLKSIAMIEPRTLNFCFLVFIGMFLYMMNVEVVLIMKVNKKLRCTNNGVFMFGSFSCLVLCFYYIVFLFVLLDYGISFLLCVYFGLGMVFCGVGPILKFVSLQEVEFISTSEKRIVKERVRSEVIIVCGFL